MKADDEIDASEQSGILEEVQASRSTQAEPFTSLKNGSHEDFLPINPHSQRAIIQEVDPKTPDGQKRLQEARRNAIPKWVYVNAIRNHCQECFGKSPALEDCGGHTLRDGTSCNLYPYNTPKKCRRSSKTDLKKAIRKECKYCGGEADSSCGKCNQLSVGIFGSGNPFPKH